MSDRPKFRTRVEKSRFTSRQEQEYEIAFERWLNVRDRISCNVVSELTLDDLRELHHTLGWFLDEGQYQG